MTKQQILVFRSILICTLFVTTLLCYSSTACARDYTKEVPTYINPAGNEFPLIAYHAFNDTNQITDQNYKLLKQCGFNVALSNLYPDDALIQMLQICHRQGLKLIVNRWGIRDSTRMATETSKFKDFPALAGILIWDEPNTSDFSTISALQDAVLSEDSKILAYTNLLPNYATPVQLKAKNYKKYIDEYIEIVNPQFLSYDNYGIVKRDGHITLRDNYFENLEIASHASQKAGIPLWTFCLSTPHEVYPNPTEGQLMFQAFSGLAYGSQCIQYYGYAPWPDAMPAYSGAPVNLKGKKQKVWQILQKVNKAIQSVSDVFLGAEVLNVWHSGNNIPIGTHRISAGQLPYGINSIISNGEGVVISHLQNNNKQFIVIVNRDFNKSQRITINKNPNVRRFISNEKTIAEKSGDITLKPGSYCIYVW